MRWSTDRDDSKVFLRGHATISSLFSKMLIFWILIDESGTLWNYRDLPERYKIATSSITDWSPVVAWSYPAAHGCAAVAEESKVWIYFFAMTLSYPSVATTINRSQTSSVTFKRRWQLPSAHRVMLWHQTRRTAPRTGPTTQVQNHCKLKKNIEDAIMIPRPKPARKFRVIF